MNIPTPDELETLRLSDTEQALATAVTRIVAEMRRQGDRTRVRLEDSELALVDQLKRAFGAKGWNAHVDRGGRDGHYLDLRPFTQDDR